MNIERFDGAIKEGNWTNIIKYDSALNSFTKAKEGKVSYDAQVVGQVEWQWDYIKRTVPSRKS